MAFYFRYEYFGLEIYFKGEFKSPSVLFHIYFKCECITSTNESGWYLNDNVLSDKSKKWKYSLGTDG